MKIVSLQLKNYKKFQDLFLTFPEGIIGIIGKNGAGKSTIFDAFLLALYGYSTADKSLLRYSQAEPKAEVIVELVFETGRKNYRIKREYRGTTNTARASLYDGQDNLIASDARVVTEEITRIIGMPQEAFLKSIFSGQKDLAAISQTRREERRKLIREMVGMNRLDELQTLHIRTDCKQHKAEIAALTKNILTPEEIKKQKEQINSSKEQLVILENQFNHLNQEKTKTSELYEKSKQEFEQQQQVYQSWQELDKQLKVIENDGIHYKKNIENLEKKLSDTAAIEKLYQKNLPEEEEYLKLIQVLEKMDKDQTLFLKQQTLTDKVNQHTKEIHNKQNLLNDLKEEQGKNKTLTDQLATFQNEEIKLQSRIDQFQGEIQQLKQQIGSVKGIIDDRSKNKNDLEKLGPESNCPLCHQPLRESFTQTLQVILLEIEDGQLQQNSLEDLLDKLTRDLNLVSDQKKQLNQQIHQLTIEITALQQKANQLKQIEDEINEIEQIKGQEEQELTRIGKLEYSPDEHERLRKNKSKKQPLYEQQLKRAALLKQIPELKKELVQTQSARAKKLSEWKAVKKKIAALHFNLNDFYDQQKDLSQKEQKKNQIADQWLKIRDQIQKVKYGMTDIEKELNQTAKIESQIEVLKNQLLQRSKLDEYLSQFKLKVLDMIKPTITEQAGDLFQQITKGRYDAIIINNDFEFFIYDEGQHYPINRFSGGEIDLANLCLRLAISKVINQLANVNLGFLCFDEIFGSQDSDRRYEILNAFNHLKEQYQQVFIISHIDEIKEELPYILEVKHSPGGAKVSIIQ
ncbi:MAG: SMC family ATPase [Spirochaetes bacterium]|nr:SMC family ATPase [Spirochaetota bacterium]